MRILHAILLLLGTPLILLVVCGFSAALFGEMVVFRRDPGTHGTGAWGSAYGILLFLALGGIAGAIIGLITAIGLISQSENKPWPRAIWIGIGIGLLVCTQVHVFSLNPNSDGILYEIFVNDVWAIPFAYVFYGAIGGYVGAAVALFRRKPQPVPRRFHDDW